MNKNNFLIFLFSCLLVLSVLSVNQELNRVHAESVQCCLDIRGNFDGDPSDIIDIGDLVYMVEYQFLSGPPLECFDEGDIFPISSPDGSIDIGDLVAMAEYQFRDAPEPGLCPLSIKIVGLQENDNTVSGIANVSDNTQYKVVLWAKTNQWYVQPTVADPFTNIQSDGSWSNSTYPWDRMLALLVDLSYVPGATRDYHPSLDEGVISWDEYPGKSIRYINWSGYRWMVKTGNLVGPGPNYFSDDIANVSIDSQDRLNLKIDYRDDKWYCSEIVLDHSLGYGTYTFKLDSRVDNLDYNTIFAGFLYETINREFDMEFSKRLADPYTAQYVVQPWYTHGNIEYYYMPASVQTSHSMEWRSDRIVFESWYGHADTSTPATIFHSWTYTGSDIPPPGNERMIFNLYLYGGEAPLLGTGDEVTVTSFDYSE